MEDQHSQTILISADDRLIGLVQACAAAIGVPVAVVGKLGDARAAWGSAAAVLVGGDLAEQVGEAGLSTRDRVWLVGHQDDLQLCAWSAPLAAQVSVLPQGGKWLSRVIAGQAEADPGRTVAIWGGAGGVGASTLCVGVAMAAARRAVKVALVDADPGGGGLDLVLGAENTPGWRWDKLRHASGQIADITAMLPKAEGITVVSMERSHPGELPGPALQAVVDCLLRTHDLVLIDVGRAAQANLGWIRRAVVVTSQTVRAIAATRVTLANWPVERCGLVVRRGGSVLAGEAAQAVGVPLIATVPTVRDLPQLADRGLPPAWSGRWKRACTRVLAWCVDEGRP
jgi:secretion/DNA translocation related CpaE-like protein